MRTFHLVVILVLLIALFGAYVTREHTNRYEQMDRATVTATFMLTEGRNAEVESREMVARVTNSPGWWRNARNEYEYKAALDRAMNNVPPYQFLENMDTEMKRRSKKEAEEKHLNRIRIEAKEEMAEALRRRLAR